MLKAGQGPMRSSLPESQHLGAGGVRAGLKNRTVFGRKTDNIN